MLTVFAAVAELEREYILQRQREGIAIAKEQGKYIGRKPMPSAGQLRAGGRTLACRRDYRHRGHAADRTKGTHILPKMQSTLIKHWWEWWEFPRFPPILFTEYMF